MRTLTVSQFIAALNEIIYTEDIAVEGEVSGFAVRSGKWAFFSLKEEDAVLECFAVAFRLGAPLSDGMRVRVCGYPNIYAQSGRLRFVVQRVEVVGEGAIRRAFEILKKKLSQEGLFAPERKRPLPRFPRVIGLITSRDAAAYTDFLRILNNRWSGVTVYLYDVRVQGPQAVGDICLAFHNFNSVAADVVVLARGGGSLEDFAAFNSEEVARAIFSSKIPVVVGVGHERDETIADYVADVRASTPSNAAELVAPNRSEITAEFSFRASLMEQAIRRELIVRHQAVRDALRAIEHAVLATVHRSRTQFEQIMHAFTKCEDTVRHRRALIESRERLLLGLDPQRLLRRGYSITFDSLGYVVKSAAEVDVGEEVAIHLGDGKLGAKVQSRHRAGST